jgi:hypothetical protein
MSDELAARYYKQILKLIKEKENGNKSTNNICNKTRRSSV